LGKEPHTVNGILADKEDELLKSGVVPVEVSEKHADSRLEEDCVGGSNLQVCTRAGNASKDGVVGPRLFLKDGVFGPKDPQPICLRTRLGDLPLTLVEGGGGVSKATEVEEVGLVNGGVGGSVVINSILSDPVHGEKGSLHLVNNSLSVPDRCMCGRTKKSTRRANPYPQGSKYRKFQELCKGGSKSKKKQGVRSDSQNFQNWPIESDPIISCDVVEQLGRRQQVCNMEGIGLEVVLHSSEQEVNSVCNELIPSVGTGGGGNGSSGVAGLMAEVIPGTGEDTVADWMVEKERGDAYHIIDIQEGLGINFMGVGGEEVERCMKLEQRDRDLKNNWVQSNGYQ
jgi:hypothetical protein